MTRQSSSNGGAVTTLGGHSFVRPTGRRLYILVTDIVE
ncbi:hypothetical protein HSB1_34910 [Halogranum salarium B-1]|uniref:Uncharacterized protein n=1 Tax=Halogranum salarium B-1 TaxID=1210908 RepID=J3JE59_9EURY|nr:hypothetical protein HSB1_34910 [Halogranum salarium B-1]